MEVKERSRNAFKLSKSKALVLLPRLVFYWIIAKDIDSNSKSVHIDRMEQDYENRYLDYFREIASVRSGVELDYVDDDLVEAYLTEEEIQFCEYLKTKVATEELVIEADFDYLTHRIAWHRGVHVSDVTPEFLEEKKQEAKLRHKQRVAEKRDHPFLRKF